MTLKLQQEMPAGSDLFRGESHQKVADQITKVIKTEDINILGLEGELGSGKSTIIQFLKKTLSPEYTFINFDAELYHYGNTKKALIEVIYEGINNSRGVNKEKLETLKNKALGNIVEYDKQVKSRLSWWTVSFILLCLLSVQMVRYLLLDLNGYLKSTGAVSPPIIGIELLAALSPGLLLLWLKLIHPKIRKKRGKIEEIVTVGDLFKQNSVDRISETWLISREIGTIELINALAGFTECGTVPNNAKFILIIDNLDRINSDKVKELWSDMELISGTTHKQFRIIVPYSARQVAKSLLVEGHSGREFIAKRIPVTFTVPPLITAGWQDAFQEMWKETVYEQGELSCSEAILILERWRPNEYPRITPRLLKKLVNDIHILQLTVSASCQEEYVLLALYIVFVRYNEREVTSLLRSNTGNDAGLAPNDFEDKVQATQEQLNRLFLNDTQRWSEYLMSIHFQSSVALARSELFDTPLTEAIKNRDSVALEKLSGFYGFSHAWRRCSAQISMQDWLETVAKLTAEGINQIRHEISDSVRILNATYAIKDRAAFRQHFSQSVANLVAGGYIGQEAFIVRQSEHLVRELTLLQATPSNDENYVTELLTEADFYSGMTGRNLLSEITADLSGEVYSMYLLNREKKYPNLHISTLSLVESETNKMLCFELSHTDSDIFNKNVIRFFDLGSKVIKELIENESGFLPAAVSKDYADFSQHLPLNDIYQFRNLIFNKEWYSAGYLQLIPYQKEIQASHPEEFAAQVVAHMVAIDDYTSISIYADEFTENEDFNRYLSYYFIYMNSFQTVIRSLSHDIAAPYVRKAITSLFVDNKLGYIHTVQYVSTYYQAIRTLSDDVDILRPMFEREEALAANINEKNLEVLDRQFIDDIFSKQSLPLVQEKIITLSESCFADAEALHTAFGVLNKNRELVLSRMKESGRFVSSNAVTHVFAEWYRTSDVSKSDNGKNIRFLWSVMDPVQRTEILRELHDILLEGDRSIERRIAVIRDFHDVLVFSEPEKKTSRRAIAALFPRSIDDAVLREWLDAQNLTLSSWSAEDAESVSHVVCENFDLFPGLTESSQYIKKRLTQNS